jgi:sodium-independent sulfate anion transporter 11
LVAGLPPQYGLYSAFVGCFVYTLFGSSKDITIGPTAIMALMTGTHAQYGETYAVLLTFLTGLIILTFGVLQLGEHT